MASAYQLVPDQVPDKAPEARISEKPTEVVPSTLACVAVPDFEIQGWIGEGAFGQVYLGLSKATGRFRAIKVVRRSRFSSDQPYEIEFAGLKRFEEVSREHEGFVDILHVSRDDRAGYFSYVMELADDLESGRQIDPARYAPRTLSKELARRGRFPAAECVRVALALTAALAELHRRDLVHRDINPRNIVFVRGVAKLADVGLITEAHLEHHTLVGTPDYMDPEVHGTPAGDLYSFGKLLYTMAAGLPPKEWPNVPPDWEKSSDLPVLRELESIWRKACQPARERRYQDGSEIHKELLALQAGASVLRLKRFEQTVRWLRRYGLPLLILLIAIAVGLFFRAQQQNQAAELRQRKVGAFVSNGNHTLEATDSLGALSWFTEAWRLDERSEGDSIHRLRVGSVLQHAPALVQMWFHDRQIKEAYFAGQENQVVISDSSGRWQVYDLVSSKPLHKPFGMGLPGETISLSSRAVRAITAAETNRIWIWNYQTGTKLRELERTDQVLALAAISPDGRWVVAAALRPQEDDGLLVWNTEQDDNEPILLGAQKQTHCLSFSPDSRLLLSSGYDNRARIWDLNQRQLITTFTNHSAWVYNGSFSPDSRHVVTASFDRTARIWEAATAKELARFTHEDGVFGAEFNSDGSRLVTAGLDYTARVWDVATQSSLQILRHNSKVLRAAFSPQDRFLLTSCFDNTVRVWHLPKTPVLMPVNGWITFDGTRLLFCTNGQCWLANQSGAVVRALDTPNQSGMTLWFAPDDRICAVMTTNQARPAERRVQLYDTLTAQQLHRSISLPWSLSNLTVCTGGRWVFAFDDKSGGLWNTWSPQRVASTSHDCKHAAFSPDAKLLAVSWSNQVEVLDLEHNFARLAGWSHPTNSEVSDLAWDAGSQRVLSSCWNNTLTPLFAQAWLARTGEAAGPPLEHRDGVLYATFSHDGRRAVTCSEDFTAMLWDPSIARQLASRLRHRNQVYYAAFSGDDRLLATAAIDSVVTIWSVETGEPLTTLVAPVLPRGRTPLLRFAPDNRALIIRHGLGRSVFWNLPFYDRPLGDLLLTSQLLSAQQADLADSLMPQSKQTLQAIWQELRSKYPADFSLPSE